MNILAVDTTTKCASVSVKTENSLYIEKVENEVTHSEKLLPLIDKVLGIANLDISEITSFALSKLSLLIFEIFPEMPKDLP